MLKIGIIVCAHGNSKAVKRLCNAYLKEKADAIAICGDLGDNFKEINSVLSSATKKLPVIAFPGSHEPAKDYYRAIKKNKHIIDGVKKRRTTINGYDLITLPGSGVNTGNASFRIAGKRITKEILKNFKLFFIRKLKKHVRNPEKTIILTHDPPKCSKPFAIDVAYSGIVKKLFVLKPKHFKIVGKKMSAAFSIAAKGEIFPEPYASKFKKLGYPVAVKHRNVGNIELRKFLKKNKINYFACGHIHEAGQKAVSAKGKSLKQGSWSKSVWYNAAPAKQGKGGILIISNNQGTFKNIKVKA